MMLQWHICKKTVKQKRFYHFINKVSDIFRNFAPEFTPDLLHRKR